MTMNRRYLKKQHILTAILLILALALVLAAKNVRKMERMYRDNQSVTVVDRKDRILVILPNKDGDYAIYATTTPKRFTELLLKKEDRYFYFHPGVNPISMAKYALARIGIGSRVGVSTLEQQVAKILLNHENDRTAAHKAVETISSALFDILWGKEEVMLKYYNSAYFGNRLRGVETASEAYFHKKAEDLNDNEIFQLLATLGNPSYNNPLLGNNIDSASSLASALRINLTKETFVPPSTVAKNLRQFTEQKDAFELKKYFANADPNSKYYKVSIDKDLSDNIREILNDMAPSLASRDAHNMAVFVMKVPTNEILTMIGSADPQGTSNGQQINMLEEPRQVASTIKPFVYVKAFEKGETPDTIIDDSEYKYVTYDGRTLYPKNYDMKYHGEVTAAYALANSINIPAIKTLEYVGLDEFAQFLALLGYGDMRKVHEHQLGAALGTIDMTLPELVHYYSIFPNNGTLSPLRLFQNQEMNRTWFPGEEKHVIDEKYTSLITKILNDRYIGIDQFGYTSDLNLPFTNYALKTGTSDDFRDSWVIGYTPDYIVGVWVGNSSNAPTKSLSGQSGAGEVWSRVMQYMHETPYDRHTPINFD